ncbi:hypothetical protein AAT19DRAFT_12543, partial [Rhodotorula toruloides]
QAPNRETTWSKSQATRTETMVGPRFEQTAEAYQPRPLAAIELIQEEPIRMVHARRAVCDGAGGALGHPRIFINLDKPGVHSCSYWCVERTLQNSAANRPSSWFAAAFATSRFTNTRNTASLQEGQRVDLDREVVQPLPVLAILSMCDRFQPVRELRRVPPAISRLCVDRAFVAALRESFCPLAAALSVLGSCIC